MDIKHRRRCMEALKARWEELAWENNVFPLYDDMVQRIAKQQNRGVATRDLPRLAIDLLHRGARTDDSSQRRPVGVVMAERIGRHGAG